MRLLDLVEQDDLIGAATDGFGELTSRFVPHVTGRRADQARDRVLLAELGEIEARHGALAVEQHLRDGLRGLGLADARWAEQEKGADGSPRAETGRVAAQDPRDAADLIAVTHHALRQDLLEPEHAIAVRFEQPIDGHVRELRHHFGHGLGRDRAARRRRVRAPARSSTLTALSGSARPGR